jgi:hypothetical protein
MPHATQETPPLKRNDAAGESDGHYIPFAPFIENDNSTKVITVQKDEESTSSSALLHILDNDPCGHFACYRATPLPPQSPCPQTLIIKSKYGVKAELTNDGSKVFAIIANKSNEPASSDLSQPEPELRTSLINLIPNLPTPRPLKTRYRYRLLPDWQTSYLWYDVTWPENPQNGPAIDFDEIEERYPELFPFYTEWQELQEEVFARHFSGDEERREEGELNTAQLLAWEVDGFFIACWLVFQDDVSAVEYKPGDVAYLLERGNLEGRFQEFIRDRIHLT